MWPMRLLAATLLVAGSGCAQLFGLDETSTGSEPTRVSLTMERWSIGASVTKNPLDVTNETATFLVDDGAGGFAKVAGEVTAPGVFSAAIDEGTPPVMFTLPDAPAPFQRLWQVPARDRSGVFSAFEHPNPQPPLPSSEIMFSATLPSMYAANESFRIEAIGAWTARGITPTQMAGMGAMTITATMPYSTFARMTSSPLARITSQDVVVIERYVGNQLTGVYQVPPFDQTDGPDAIAANISAVSLNKPLSGMATPAAYQQRFSAVRPAVTGLAQSWIVTAAPGWLVGLNTGPRLHAGSINTVDPQPATADITAMFGNPFESLDWRALLQFSTQSTRSHMFMGLAAMTLSASMVTLAEPSGTLMLDMPAGLPINIRANQVPLSTDGMMVPLDLTKAVEIDAIIDRPPGTIFTATLYEVALSADMMQVERSIVVEATGTGEPKVLLPPELFEVGTSYYVDFRVMNGGYLEAATGDLQTVTLPYSVSRADSAVFQVVAP